MNVDPRPRSTRVAIAATNATGSTLWSLSVSDLTLDQLDALLPRLTALKVGEFKAYLEAHPGCVRLCEHEVGLE